MKNLSDTTALIILRLCLTCFLHCPRFSEEHIFKTLQISKRVVPLQVVLKEYILSTSDLIITVFLISVNLFRTSCCLFSRNGKCK